MKIRVENASVSFGKKEILQGISISLPEKELVMVIGPNGCGKTTFLRLLMGFQKPQSGMVFYNDISLQDHTVLEKSRKMAYMPQNPRRQEDDEVFDYVLLGVTPYLNYFSLPGKEEKEQAEQVLAELGLSEFKNRRMGTLSGGEQQMVNFARARMQNTPWLILDEPMASLDYSRQLEFMHRLVEYEKRYGQGILMSVHDPNFALRYADRVIVMGYGKIEGIVSRRENEFENKLTGILNKSYDGHLQLIEKEDYHFYYWKEETHVSCKGICESRESERSL